MSITIQLPVETETALREKAKREGKTPEQLLVQLTQEKVGTSGTISPANCLANISVEEWIVELRAWAASHQPMHHFVDDSRESIYSGRGE